MFAPLEKAIVCDTNREGFEYIINITHQEDDAPKRVFLSGPKGSGKTVVTNARADEKDLLSTKSIAFCHAAEIMVSVELDNERSDAFLEKIGTSSILIIDGYETFLENDEFGQEMTRLLVGARNEAGFTTVLVSDEPLSAYKTDKMEGVLDDFKEITVAPLDAEGRTRLAEYWYRVYTEGAEAPVLPEETLSYIANEFIEDLNDLNKPIRYLTQAAELPAGIEVSVAQARQLLGA